MARPAAGSRGEKTVFDVHCAACARHLLITPSQVTGIVNDAAGIHVEYRCRCGALGVLHTGRARHEDLAHAS